MKNKKKLIILSIVAILLIVVLSSASYAYFTTSGSTGTEETITSGTMALTFSDGPQINATNLAPGDYIEKTFSVTNTGTLATTYDVYLSEVVNTFVQKNDLVYEITSNDGGYNTVNQVVVPNVESKIVDTQSIGVGATHHYILKITYKLTNQIQNDNMGRGFTAKININEYNLNNTEKLLKLLDTSGNLVDKQMISSGVTDYYYNLANTSLTGTTNIYCNNGGIPRIENNQLIVSGLTVDTECKMSSNVVDSVNNNFTTNKMGVVMTNNQNITKLMTVPDGKEVVFDLNGKEINSTVKFFENRGTLRVNDSVGTGSVFTNNNTVSNFSTGNLIISGGRYESDTYTVLPNEGNITINGGNFYRTGSNVTALLSNNGSGDVTINDGYFESSLNGNMINTGKGVFTVNGGTFKSLANTLWNGAAGGTLIINDGYFESTNLRAVHIRNNTVTNINNGTFKSSGSHTIVVENNDNAILNFNNGKILSGPNSASSLKCIKGQINIKNGYIESKRSNSFINGVNCISTIDGDRAQFDSNGNYVSGLYIYRNNEDNPGNNMPTVANDGDLTIYDGTFKNDSLHNALFNTGELKVYDGLFDTVSIYAVWLTGGHSYFYGGTFNGCVAVGTYNDGTTLHSGSQNYFCGGSFNSSGNNFDITDETSTTKYKSSVVWVGKSSPTVAGNYPSTVSLDDTITCPS